MRLFHSRLSSGLCRRTPSLSISPASISGDQMIEPLPDVWFDALPQAARNRAAQLERAIWLGDNLNPRSNDCVANKLDGTDLAQAVLKKLG